MQAIEFIAKAKNGVIKIPQEYLNDVHGELRVIVLVATHVVSQEKKKRLKALQLKTKGVEFDRDVANER